MIDLAGFMIGMLNGFYSWRRQQKGLSQLDLAAKLQSSQSRVAKMEAGDPSVSLDLLIRSLISLGTTERGLSGIITTQRAA